MGNFHQPSNHHDDELAAFLTPRRRIAYGGAAMLIALAVLATVFGPWRPPAANLNLAAATSGKPPLLLIRFSTQATQPQINAFLGTYHAEVVSGPRRGNFYDIRITGQPSAAEVATIVRRMQDETALVDLIAEKE